ncbi:cyclase family protein [bacterium]|nr:cyclase family protein [bacterium]
MTDWIDISTPLHPGLPVWPGDPPFKIRSLSSISNGAAFNLSEIAMSSHAGTHLDAPRHCFDNGAPAESAPLDSLIGPARVIEIAEPVGAPEIDWLRIGQGERVLFKTGGRMDLLLPEAAERLVTIGVALVGIDALSIGAGDEAGDFIHRTLLGAGIWILETLDLSQVSPGDYDLICLPLKIIGADGVPARAVLRPR